MSRNWKLQKPHIAGIARGCAQWLRTPQPRSGQLTEDADGRRSRVELDAIRARFPDHA